ncbi:hypothetical protein CTAYLR_009205 [Chrysophaeum taylorii]|uniref:Radical SAM core domain-containing protein n=1 Tax=Chrysophaeum taylorii TaxID=2483200 RepID=A0AAD7XJD4_9STRA|nr:hypothetical protein CTAYLR_009205 [Chrysophaeum taylorii]
MVGAVFAVILIVGGGECLTMSTRTLSLPTDELAALVGGTGRAKSVWDEVRRGIEPLSSTSRITSKTRAALEAAGVKQFVPGHPEAVSVARDGTTKLLVRFDDGLAVETVLIPHLKLPRTTLCVSTQVGCDRGCGFCATAAMGLARNLTACEIAAQFYWAKDYATAAPLTNVVFMGMGDAGVNCDASAAAAVALTDHTKFGLARSKVTISTVGPSPTSFRVLAQSPGMLAWSVHAADDDLRRQLVPTQRYSLIELRAGLVDALASRPTVRMRTLMIAATLIQGVNDRDDDAVRLAEFVGPLVDVATKVLLDLIPVNAVDHAPHFQRPDHDRIFKFMDVLRRVEPRVHVAVRITRGDDECAACGQLAVKDSQARVVRRRQRLAAAAGSSSAAIS